MYFTILNFNKIVYFPESQALPVCPYSQDPQFFFKSHTLSTLFFQKFFYSIAKKTGFNILFKYDEFIQR